MSVFIPDNSLGNVNYRRSIAANNRTSVAAAIQDYAPPVWPEGFPTPYSPTVYFLDGSF